MFEGVGRMKCHVYQKFRNALWIYSERSQYIQSALKWFQDALNIFRALPIYSERSEMNSGRSEYIQSVLNILGALPIYWERPQNQIGSVLNILETCYETFDTFGTSGVILWPSVTKVLHPISERSQYIEHALNIFATLNSRALWNCSSLNWDFRALPIYWGRFQYIEDASNIFRALPIYWGRSQYIWSALNIFRALSIYSERSQYIRSALNIFRTLQILHSERFQCIQSALGTPCE